jgi:hypothetical protein
MLIANSAAKKIGVMGILRVIMIPPLNH